MNNKLHKSQQCTLAATEVDLTLGCFSAGTASRLGNMVIPPLHGTGEAAHEILDSVQGHPVQERHGQAGPSSVGGNQGSWQLEDMTHVKGTGVALSAKQKVKERANYLLVPKEELLRRETKPFSEAQSELQ